MNNVQEEINKIKIDEAYHRKQMEYYQEKIRIIENRKENREINKEYKGRKKKEKREKRGHYILSGNNYKQIITFLKSILKSGTAISSKSVKRMYPHMNRSGIKYVMYLLKKEGLKRKRKEALVYYYK